MRFTTVYQTMGIAVEEVFFRRSLMMASGSTSANDAVRMVAEKATTFADAAGEATAAPVKGIRSGSEAPPSHPTAHGPQPTCANCAADPAGPTSAVGSYRTSPFIHGNRKAKAIRRRQAGVSGSSTTPSRS
jgi:hypothetical protein